DADLAVFPELFLSGYSLREVVRAARAAGGAELAAVADAARAASTAVVVGFVERTADGVANSVACIERDGTLRCVYRKVQLFGAETDAFVPGRELVVVELAGRRVAPLICFDVEFPELARRLAVAGADLLVTASANMEPFYADHDVATRARALENRIPHLYANLVGSSGPLRFVGGSRSIGPGGDVLTEAAHTREEVLVASVAPAGADDERVDYVRQLPQDVPVVVA
ncbi:MAG TPA: nitrilase-related carbon-nitrogen hydrolase, partial [Gaiellaceae bacterium]|nr:nitrilase-related carbon-nitrogen hydrolase [Gaiellaceae bacterium]